MNSDNTPVLVSCRLHYLSTIKCLVLGDIEQSDFRFKAAILEEWQKNKTHE